MAEYVPAKINTAFIFYASLVSQANTKINQVNPTIAAGDFKVSIDGGALANLATLPAVTPAGSTMVKFSLSAGEMNGDNITVVCLDAAGAEWCDVTFTLQTVARQMADLCFPTTSGRSLDVTATGGAGIDWSNVEAPTTTLNLSGTTIKTATDVATATTAIQADTDDIQARLPAALTAGGNMKADALAWNALATVELPLVPTTAGRKLDVSAGGEAGLDWANIGSPSTTIGLSGTTIKDVTDVNVIVTGTALIVASNQVKINNIQTRLPTLLVGGRMDSSVGAMGNDVLTAAAIATDAIDADALAADAIAEIQSGLSTLTAAGVRAAVGLAAANLDTQLAAGLAAIAALNNLSAAQVNAEVVDALATDTYAEPTGVPPATASLATKIGRLHQALRNGLTVTGAAKTFQDDSAAALWKKPLSDDGVTYTEGEGTTP